MTIENERTYQVLESTGTTDPYPFNIIFITKETIKVAILTTEGSKEELAYGRDYIVIPNTNNKSGYVEFLRDYPRKGQKVIIQRKSDIKQNVAFPPNINFRESNIELMGDKIVLQTQELAEQKTMKIPVELEGISNYLPYPNPGKALAWSKDGTQLINANISSGGGKSDVPDPSEGKPGDLLRVDTKKSAYELFNLGIREAKNGNPAQILRVSEDKERYEFSDLPKFPKNSDENIGKIPVLLAKDQFKYLKLSDMELVGVLEFEKILTYGESATDDLRFNRNELGNLLGTKYALNFIYDPLDLKDKEVEVFIYILSIERVKINEISKDNLTRFLIELSCGQEEYSNLTIKFEFSGKNVKSKIFFESKTVTPGIHSFFIKSSCFPIDLKVKASIYRPVL